MYKIEQLYRDEILEGYAITQNGKRITTTDNLGEIDAYNFCKALNEAEMLKEDLKNSKRGTILAEANELIYGDRAAAYGPVSVSFERIAKFWETILTVPVTAEQVGLCMIALKMSRQISKSGRDNLVDIAGYAGCIAKMEEEKAAN